MKSFVVIVMMLGSLTVASSSFFQDIVGIVTSCGITWHIDMDQVPDHVTDEEFFEYVESVDNLLCQ